MLDPALRDLATKYGVNPDKPFFPVNSLRILYFLISDHYTQNNDAVKEKIGMLIPKVEAVIAFRINFRREHPQEKLSAGWQAFQTPLQDIYNIIRTPQIEHAFSQYYWYLTPLQEEVLVNMAQQPNLPLLLKARAMDSLLYATLIHGLITQLFPAQDLYQPLLHQLNVTYQLNDLVDAVVFAKEDLTTNHFSPFRAIQQITQDPQAAKEFIRTTLATLLNDSKDTPFPPPLQAQMTTFLTTLANTVLG
jgi:hypothetical protein